MPKPNVRNVHLGVSTDVRGQELYLVNYNPSPVKFSVQVYYYDRRGDQSRKDRIESGRLERFNTTGSRKFLGGLVIDGGAGEYCYSITTVSIENPPAPPPLIVKADQKCPRTGTWQAEGYTHKQKFAKNAIMRAYQKSTRWKFIS